MEIGAAIREKRKARGWSQAALAERVGTHQQTIEKIERGTVKHSRYLPMITAALGIETPNPGLQNSQKAAPSNIPASQLVGDRDLPVYGAAEGGEGALVVSNEPVDFVRRPAPLAQVKDGYGLIVVGESMVPELKPGETALVHPHLPPIAGEPCVFYSDDGHGEQRATLKSFIKATLTHWHVEQWNPPKKLTLDRKLWHRCERIVGRYARR